MNHYELVFGFIELFHSEWIRLPPTIRQLIVEHPEMFKLVTSEKEGGRPVLKYGDVSFRYESNKSVWVIDTIVPQLAAAQEPACPF